MNTQLSLDDSVIKQAMHLTGIKNTQEVVDFALCELVAKIKQEHPVELPAKQDAKPVNRAYDIYMNLDLGPGGYSPVPSNRAKQSIKDILKRRIGR